jgi:1,2-diacylglycerol 3-alpha-glucosyltransferase
MPEVLSRPRCRVAVIWIDWYAYHVARFRGLDSVPSLSGRVCGIELVGGIGVHAGLKFREALPEDLWIETLMPEASWRDADHWKLARILWAKLNQLNPEIVLVPGYYTLPGFAAALWARVHGRVSVLMTESTASDHQRVWWKERLKGLGLRSLFDWAVSGGKEHVAYLRQLGFPEERVVGFYDVVDNDMFARGVYLKRLQTPEESGFPREYFLYVGRLAEEKNVVGLMRSWLDYRAEGGTWPLMLVGDGPEMKGLKALAEASGFAEDVYFPGLKSSAELVPYYAFASCFVLPSTREPWGLVVNEAMASGLPVLVSERCGCAADLVFPALNGFVFNPTNSVELREKMRAMEQLSFEQRSRMGKYSAELIRGYSPRKFGMSIASIAVARSREGQLEPATGGMQ